MTYGLGLALSAVIVIHTIPIGGIKAIMGSERSMSSGFWPDRGQFSALFHGKQGVEIGLPKCVHFHVIRSKQAARRKELDALLDPAAPSDVARMSLALRILEHGGAEYVALLLSQPEGEPSGVGTPETLVRQLVGRYALNQLVDIAKELIVSPEVRTWIEQAAASADETPEASRKAAIAHALVQHAGVEAVRQRLEPTS